MTFCYHYWCDKIIGKLNPDMILFLNVAILRFIV